MKVSLIDSMAWMIVRLGGLLTANIMEVVLKYYKPRNIEEMIDLTGTLMSGWFIFGAKSPEDVPDFARRKLLFQGKFILLIIVGAVFIRIAMAGMK